MSPAKAAEPDVNGDFAAARRVFEYAGAAITALSSTLGPSFTAAVDALLATQGRVIVSGMGKSGHIARKIAATLASTGTPAHFIHPAEAGHGDLGEVTKGDVLVMLSNSGDTEELSHLIAFAKRFSIPIIGIAGRAESLLLQAADVALLLPKAQEACPMGLAPTTSTTMQLVLGDALAVALMERRGFSADNYRELHPSGSLGRALIRVSDLMHGEFPLVTVAEPMREVLILMTSFGRFGFAGVVGVKDDKGALIGIITDGDLRRHIHENPADRVAGDLMTKNPKTIAEDALAAEALALMNKANITSLFVTEDGNKKPVGLLHIHDCLRAGIQ